MSDPDANHITTTAALRAMTPREIEKARREGRIDIAAVAADRDRLAAENAARIRQRHDPNQEKTNNG